MSDWLDGKGNAFRPPAKCRRPSPARTILAMSLLVLGAAVAGCGDSQELMTDYGHRRGRAAASVNGTSVLAEMFREAGGRPTTLYTLSSSLNNFDVVVWAPNDFAPPDQKAREFLEEWLVDDPGRTLVYIGRDYDAAIEYWNRMIPAVDSHDRIEVMRRAAEARAAHSKARIDMPADDGSEWFVTRRDFPGQTLHDLDGPWSLHVDGPEARIWLQGRLEIPSQKDLKTIWNNEPPSVFWEPEYRPLLVSGDKTLAFEVTKSGWDASRIIVVSNGSFLLNLPLVNHQHRKLAGELIKECQPFGKIAFLESGPGGPLVHGNIHKLDENARRMRIVLAAHWFFLGAVFCFFVFPIFGRPKTIETDTPADFGNHVDATAALLERTGNIPYARQQLEHYRQWQGGEALADPQADKLAVERPQKPAAGNEPE